MTKEEAEELGYEVIRASSFEVGLCKNGKGLRTWFCEKFDYKLPDLDHPIIVKSIENHERVEADLRKLKGAE